LIAEYSDEISHILCHALIPINSVFSFVSEILFMRLALLTLLSLWYSAAVGQTVTWSAPITIASGSHGNLFPRLVLDRSGDPMVVWGAVNANAYFSRWTGTGFSLPMAVNPSSIPVFTANWAGPEIGSHGDTVYVVFKQTPETDTASHIYLAHSFDAGQSFSAPVRVDHIGDSLSRFGSVTTDTNGHPIVGFMKFDQMFMEPRHVVARSFDHGMSFGPDVKASNNVTGEACDCCPAAIIHEKNNVAVLYRNNVNNKRTIWAGISYDAAGSFSEDISVDNTNWMIMGCPSSGPDGIVVGDTMYTVFRSSVSGSRIYLAKADFYNHQFVSCNMFNGGNILTAQDYPRIAHSGDAAAGAWKQVESGVSKLCFSFTPAIQGGFATSYDTLFSSGVANLDMAMKDGDIHVVWGNSDDGTLMYRKGTYAPAGIDHLAGALPVDIFPNPATASVTIPLMHIRSVVATDLQGRQFELIGSEAGGNTIMSVKVLASGIYTLQLTDDNGLMYYSKLTVE
jgi:hypothetical protein